MRRFTKLRVVLMLLAASALCGCEGLVPHDTESLLIPRFQRSEIFGFLAGLGTTFPLFLICWPCFGDARRPA